MNNFSAIRKLSAPYIRSSILPIMLAIYPVLFLFGNNVNAAVFSSLGRLLFLFSGIAIILFSLLSLVVRDRAVQAANKSFVLLLFFHTYGIAFNQLVNWDVIQIKHYTLLPLFILLGIYSAWLIGRLGQRLSNNFWQGATIIVSVLVVFNIVKITLAEIRKDAIFISEPITVPVSVLNMENNYPDIYYIVFDEMVGFEAMRQFWNYNEVDEFVESLKSGGFYVAEESRSKTRVTFHELANRLNYEDRPYVSGDADISASDLAAIADNKAMRYLKSLGYTTIVFSELRSDFIFPAAPQIMADYLYEKPEMGINTEEFDDFSRFVVKNTVLKPFITEINLSAVEQHKDMIHFTVDKIGNLEDIPEPKFVFVHLAFPHKPFLFQANGNLNKPKDYGNWDKYLGNYIYSLQIAERINDHILASADPAHPPVIIIQSDHGARNAKSTPADIPLTNYPDEYKQLIVNALYLPGCNKADLSQDMNPINTFPIVFNCYFDANIPLQ